MDFFSEKEIIALTWNGRRHVFGIRVKPGGEKALITGAVENKEENASFSERLSDVFKRLEARSEMKILMGGQIDGAFYELLLPPVPPKEMGKLLDLELARSIPLPPAGTARLYRVLPGKIKERKRIRIFAFRLNDWNELLGEITASGLAVDAIVPPFLAIDSDCASREVYIPSLDPDFVFAKQPDGTRKMVGRPDGAVPDSTRFLKDIFDCDENFESGEYAASLLLASYVLNGGMNDSPVKGMDLPSEILPRRHMRYKAAALLSGLLVTMLALSFAARKCYGNWNAWNGLRNEVESIARKTAAIDSEITRNSSLDSKIAKIRASRAESIDVFRCLTELDNILPENHRLTSFNHRGDSVNITMHVPTGTSKIMAKLNNSSLFSAGNIRRRRNPDRSYHIYLTLNMKGNPDEF